VRRAAALCPAAAPFTPRGWKRRASGAILIAPELDIFCGVGEQTEMENASVPCTRFTPYRPRYHLHLGRKMEKRSLSPVFQFLPGSLGKLERPPSVGRR